MLSQQNFFSQTQKWNWGCTQSEVWSGSFVRQREPFTCGDLIELCFIVVAEEIRSEKINLSLLAIKNWGDW